MRTTHSTLPQFCATLISALVFLFHDPATCIALTPDEVVKKIQGVTPAQRKAALEEGARKEGEVIWYTSMSFTDYPKMVGAFEKVFPFIKVKANRLSQSTILTKVDTEAKAGRVSEYKVGAATTEIWEWNHRGYSAGYLSPELK